MYEDVGVGEATAHSQILGSGGGGWIVDFFLSILAVAMTLGRPKEKDRAQN
jgi:hypothetical protein